MKKILLNVWVTAIAISLMAFSCEKDADLISYQSLPNSAQSFIGQYFSNTTVIKTEAESNGGYSVDLSNGTEIDFNSTGNWVKVDARDGQTLSNTDFILSNIVKSIAQNYPQNPINGIEKKNNGYEVELVGVAEDIYFDANGNTVSSSNSATGGTNSPTTSVGNVPQNVNSAAESFLNTYFPSIKVMKVEVESNKVEYDLANGVDVDFDLNGNWINVDAPDGQTIPNGFIPTEIVNYVKANYPNNAFNSIEKKNNGYEVELVGIAKDIYFDANGSIVNSSNSATGGTNSPTTPVGNVPQNVNSAAESFLNTYFPSIKVTKVEVESNKVEYDLANGVDVDFDLNGNWINVDAPDGQAIPNGFIPSTIVSYVKANYPNNAFNSIEKKNGIYEIELIGFGRDLIFNLSGNFIQLD